MGFISVSWLILLWLATHRSESPVIFHCYSVKYAFFLSAIFCMVVACSLMKQQFYRYRRVLALLLISLCGALVTAETYLRLADPLGLSYFQETSRYQLDRISDPALVFRHRPFWKATYQGVEVRFNEFGLRDEPIGPKMASEYRVLILGDSVPFGWGVQQEQTFPAKLQQILTIRSGQPVRVINGGVAGYNTVQEYTFLEKQGLSFEPDLILLFYHSNDIETTVALYDPSRALSLEGKSPPQLLEVLLERTWLYRLIVYAARYGWFSADRPSDHQVEELTHSPGWIESMNALRAMSRLCGERKIPLAVFFVRVWATPLNDALLEEVRHVTNPVPIQDMRSWFAGKELRSYMNSRVDPHFNVKGHQVTAERTADFLVHQLGVPMNLQLSATQVH
ncbi:MAG: SGNH/GDSL hydrolase family protein [Nitrospiraceae bacterium]